jgi:hypothetical protein
MQLKLDFYFLPLIVLMRQLRARQHVISAVWGGNGDCVRARDLLALTRKAAYFCIRSTLPSSGAPSPFPLWEILPGARESSLAAAAGWVLGHLPLAHTTSQESLRVLGGDLPFSTETTSILISARHPHTYSPPCSH